MRETIDNINTVVECRKTGKWEETTLGVSTLVPFYAIWSNNGMFPS